MSRILPNALAAAGTAPISLNHILRAVRTHLKMEVGFISEFLGGRRIFRHVETADDKACIEVGGSDPLEESYCYWIAEGKLARLICDPNDHPIAAAMPVTKELPVGAHLSVPIYLRDGTIYGTFCCFSFEPDHSLTERDLATIEAFAQVAAEQIQQTIDSGTARAAKLSRVQGVLRERDVRMVFQPAFRVDTGEVAFVEALARFYAKPSQSPDRWFSMAAEVGLAVELELLAVKAVLAELAQLPEPVRVSINTSPQVIVSPEFAAMLEGAPLKRLIVEITEHDTVSHYCALNRALAPLRTQGLRVAVDDMGAGYSSLRHILQIRPDLVKLDVSLSRDIDKDPVRRALASALVSFARDTNSELVAEGVETKGELETLRSIGAEVVQGFLFGSPKPLTEQPALSGGAQVH